MTPTREVLWNVNSPTNVFLLYALLAPTLLLFFNGVLRRIDLWRLGKPDPLKSGRYGIRFMDFVFDGLLQRRTLKWSFQGLAHLVIFWGFIALLFTTTVVFVHHDLGIKIYQGRFYLFVTVLSDCLGFLFLIGLGMMAYKRFISKPFYQHTGIADGYFLGILALLLVQGYALEGLRIHVTSDPWAIFSPIGYLTAKLFWSLTHQAASSLHFVLWWFHTLTVYVFIGLFPYTKAFHAIASPINLFFRRRLIPDGACRPTPDIMKMVEKGADFSMGIGRADDYRWSQILELDACTSCGRCQSVCPAYISGKVLSPKWLIVDSRAHILKLRAKGLFERNGSSSGLFAAIDRYLLQFFYFLFGSTSQQDSSESVREAVRSCGEKKDQLIAGEVLDRDVFWSCTTCMACVEECPVGIFHVDHIVEARRNMALMRGEIPTEAQQTLRSLENRGNAYGDQSLRADWTEGLDVRVLKEGDSVDVLYWVGCISAYDKRKQNIARSVVQLLKIAGVDFGILGSNEMCTGDPARRLGEENLFQTLAKQNLSTLNSISFNTIIANCPHCFNTLLNEYPTVECEVPKKCFRVMHHSTFLMELVRQGKINIRQGVKERITFHDPCYLGRYNKEYKAPRDIIKYSSKSLNIIEMKRSKERSMCCGAGGGHFWMDMKKGERINKIRMQEVVQTGANVLATACPFCMHMLEDGAKMLDKDEDIIIKDISEILIEAVAEEAG